MKRRISLILAAGLLAALAGCGSQPVSTADSEESGTVTETVTTTAETALQTTAETVTAAAAATVTVTVKTTAAVTSQPAKTTVQTTAKPASTTAVTEAPKKAAVWEINGCRLTLPESWAGFARTEKDMLQFIPTKNKDGLGYEFFRVMLLSEFDLVKSSDGLFTQYVLGTKDGAYICAVMPPGFANLHDDPEIYAEFEVFSKEFERVMQTAVCLETPDFEPIPLHDYRYPDGDSYSFLGGSWDVMPDPGVQMTPYVTFRQRDNGFGYKYALNSVEFGSFIPDLRAGDYQWNTDNWGPAGAVFLNGSIYIVTVYATAPQTLNFRKVSGKSDLFGNSTFQRTDDYEGIFEDNFGEIEKEMP